MSITNANLPVLLAQLPHLARISAADQNHPEISAALNEELIKQAAERRRQRVQGTEKSDFVKQLKEDDQGKQKRQASSQRKKEEEPEEEEFSEPTSPWAGNIINTKI